MRLLTGKDRIAFESVLQGMASLSAENVQLREWIEKQEEENLFIRSEVTRERQRADNAIDELLAMRGIAPVSVPPEPRDLSSEDPFAEDPVEVAKIEQRMKDEGFGAVLLTEGRG